ncbi:hypothetical protein ATCC90586_003359 [Pythium insidiosum]|nr:hypothetical protein ATCC90586_003359 [Pythium insidiosum]
MLILGSVIALLLCITCYAWFYFKSKQLEADGDMESDEARSDHGDLVSFDRQDSAAAAQRKPQSTSSSIRMPQPQLRAVPILGATREDSHGSRFHP